MTHTMELKATHANGAQEWLCPLCGRHMMLSYKPFSQTVFTPGDVTIGHRGSTGGLSMSVNVHVAMEDLPMDDWAEGVKGLDELG